MQTDVRGFPAIVFGDDEIFLVAPETEQAGEAVHFPLVAAAIHHAIMVGDERIDDIVADYIHSFALAEEIH
jgi:hypothetical protein